MVPDPAVLHAPPLKKARFSFHKTATRRRLPDFDRNKLLLGQNIQPQIKPLKLLFGKKQESLYIHFIYADIVAWANKSYPLACVPDIWKTTDVIRKLMTRYGAHAFTGVHDETEWKQYCRKQSWTVRICRRFFNGDGGREAHIWIRHPRLAKGRRHRLPHSVPFFGLKANGAGCLSA